MKPLKFVALLLSGLASAISLFGDALFVKPSDWTPFLERIDPKEFLVIENKLSESLSDTNDLVIYDTHFYPLARSFALKRKLGYGYVLKVKRPSHTGPLVTTTSLPSDIANRLLSVMEFSLTNRVYAPTGKALEHADDSYVWINLRIDSNRTLSGMVRLGEGRCLVGQGVDSNRPFLEILSRMTSLGTGEDSGNWNEYDALGFPPLFMLDLAISNLRLSYPPTK